MPEHHWYQDLRLRIGTHRYSISPIVEPVSIVNRFEYICTRMFSIHYHTTAIKVPTHTGLMYHATVLITVLSATVIVLC